MAKRKRRSLGKLLRGAVKDVVMPTSMGLGIALGGCGSSGDKSDVPTLAVMPPADAARKLDAPAILPPANDARADGRDGYAIMPLMKDARADGRDGYAIMPPTKDAQADGRDGYAIMPPMKDASPDSRDARPDVPIYSIMPYRPESPDLGPYEAASDRRDATPDTSKPNLKEVGPIFAIMPLAVLPPPRG